ncbi:MAG: ATP-binding protein, partial [Lentimicrobiaceae bacterium]|nr:ATP-binding protein [Lentimicrobiaceae bacterium]
MPTDTTPLHQQFVQIAQYIESLISETDHFSDDLNQIEYWLKNHLESIRLKRLDFDSSIFIPLREDNERYDGIIIFNKDLKVQHFVASHHYFYGPDFNKTGELHMSSFLFEDELHMLNEMINLNSSDAFRFPAELNLKSGPGSRIRAFITIKPFNESDSNQQFMALLRFPDSHELLFTTYYETILNNLPGMDIYLFDRNYRFIISGGKEKEKHGYDNDHYVGKTFFEVLDKKVRRSLFPFYSKALNGQSTEGEIRFHDQIYYVVAKPIFKNGIEPIAGLVVAQNITNDKLLEQQLRQRKNEAQRADHAKSIFIANISHEIRTPLNSIIGFIEQLEKTSLNKEQQDLVSIIQKASDHLLYLVNEVVFLFKLGLGKIYFERIPFSLNETLEDLYNMMLPKARVKNLQLFIDNDNCPLTLVGDPFRVKQILMNLLSNAIKFTDNGEIRLKCIYKLKKSKQVEVTFIVSDTGAGIPKEDLPNIFDVFEQGATLTRHSVSGAGLGLGICQRLTTLMDGEISVKSKIKQGSEFKVILPFQIFEGNLIKEKSKTYLIKDKLLKGKRILLADDDKHSLMLAERIIKGWEVNYTLVANGCEAMDALANDSFDILIVDINMPCKNGVEVITALRNDAHHINGDTPAISLSANIQKSDILSYMKAGFNDYLTKPYTEEQLYNKLCAVLYQQASNARPVAEPEVSDTDTLDLSELKRTAGADKEFFNKMMQNFIQQCDSLLEAFEQATT